MVKLVQQGALPKPWRRRRQGPTCIREEVNNWPRSIGERDGAEPSRNGPRPVSPGWPAWPVSGPVRTALCPRCLSIYCLCLRWPPHPSIHQRAANMKEKHQEEADDRLKSSSCLGDGLGHALAAMVGPAVKPWWSSGAASWIRQVVCSFTIRWWYKSILVFTLIYYELWLFLWVATLCL
jgi:hypothetical protein